MKICTKCNINKNLDCFNKDKGGHGGYCAQCKDCRKKYRRKNSKHIKEYNEEYRKNNPEKFKELKKEYLDKFGDREKQKRREYHYANKKEQNKKSREWKKNNRDKIREYKKYRYNNDIQYKLSEVLRSRVHSALNGKKKVGSANRDLGCSTKELIKHIEEKFYPHPKTGEMMTWKNWKHDGWHIDHIKPLSSFDLTNRDQFLQACSFTNLQPLWAEENYLKSNK